LRHLCAVTAVFDGGLGRLQAMALRRAGGETLALGLGAIENCL
jgi:hypothetical protein